jgi:hypothetical protein
MNRPSMNAAGDVAFSATPLGSSLNNLYVRPSTGSIPLTINGSNLRVSPDSQPIILDNGTVFFQAAPVAGGPMSLYGASPTAAGYSPPTLIVPGGVGPDALEPIFSASPDGLIIAILTKTGYSAYSASASFTGGLSDTTPTRLISIGDSVDGSTVASFALSESSFLPNGDSVVFLTLADGTRGFYNVVIPEPATAATMAVTSLALLVRRRR